ncbi:MAG: hypothetical protein HOP96_02795 [Sphingomonas sp.]|nr:hypothetical protein [Sphingomonas sp.]
MDDPYAPRPLAGWFKYAAIAAVLFMAIGCAGYLASVLTDPKSLPLDQRNLMEARPTWMIAAYAIAVWVGLAGAILLLMRRKPAEPLLLVSLIAAVLTFLPYFIVPAVSDLVTTNDIAFAVVIVLITGTIWSFARHSRQRGWLR